MKHSKDFIQAIISNNSLGTQWRFTDDEIKAAQSAVPTFICKQYCNRVADDLLGTWVDLPNVQLTSDELQIMMKRITTGIDSMQTK